MIVPATSRVYTEDGWVSVTKLEGRRIVAPQLSDVENGNNIIYGEVDYTLDSEFNIEQINSTSLSRRLGATRDLITEVDQRVWCTVIQIDKSANTLPVGQIFRANLIDQTINYPSIVPIQVRSVPRIIKYPVGHELHAEALSGIKFYTELLSRVWNSEDYRDRIPTMILDPTFMLKTECFPRQLSNIVLGKTPHPPKGWRTYDNALSKFTGVRLYSCTLPENLCLYTNEIWHASQLVGLPLVIHRAGSRNPILEVRYIYMNTEMLDEYGLKPYGEIARMRLMYNRVRRDEDKSKIDYFLRNVDSSVLNIAARYHSSDESEWPYTHRLLPVKGSKALFWRGLGSAVSAPVNFSGNIACVRLHLRRNTNVYVANECGYINILSERDG